MNAAMRWAAPAVRLIGAVVLMTAMLSRALIPAGWMPGPAGGAPLVICTGHGPATPARDHDPGPAPQRGHDICAFAGHVGSTPPQPAGVVVASMATPAEAPGMVAASVVAHPGPPRSQSPRAPPAFA